MKIRKKLRIAVPMAGVMLGLVMASVAWACTSYNGETYFEDPTTLEWKKSHSVSARTVKGGDAKIRILGDGVILGGYETKDGDKYWPVISAEGDCCGGSGVTYLGTEAEQFELQTAMTPDIGPGERTIPSTTGKGNHWICILNTTTTANDSTGHATLSVL